MTLVFIHGAGCTSLAFARQKTAFDDALFVDLPGRPGGLTGPATAAEFANWVDDYIRLHGLKNVVLCGHSMGGAVALELSLRRPGWLRGLVLLGSGARLRVAPAVLHNLREEFEATARELASEYYFASPRAEWIAQAVADMKAVGEPQTERDFRACDAFDLLDRLGEVSSPLLALTGEHDKMTPPKYGLTFADRVPGGKARILPGAGHFVMVERPEETNTEIRSFLSGITS